MLRRYFSQLEITHKEKEAALDPVLQDFQKRYQAWVEDSLEEFKAQKMDRIVRNYPFVIYQPSGKTEGVLFFFPFFIFIQIDPIWYH